MKFIQKCRVAEVDYDASEEIAKINDYFNRNLRYLRNETAGQETYHIDYGNIIDMPHWIWLANMFEQFMKEMGSCLDMNQIKHMLKFSFIRMPPHGVLPPHTASFLRAMSSINIPLRGKCIIDLYGDKKGNRHVAGDKIISHHYTSPICLNVNEFHGVVNNTDEERMMLKVHLLATPWTKLVNSFEYDDDHIANTFDFPMPWSHDRGTYHKI
jgi:hypothetical protein